MPCVCLWDFFFVSYDCKENEDWRYDEESFFFVKRFCVAPKELLQLTLKRRNCGVTLA